MLPTDMCIRTDPVFSVYARRYATDEALFFHDFGLAYSKLLELGVPEPIKSVVTALPNGLNSTEQEKVNGDFREYAMHGSIEKVTQFRIAGAIPDSIEGYSARTALHKAAFWGHTHVIKYLIDDCHVNVNMIDYNGDTALHDAARFAHESVVELLINSKSDLNILNKDNKTPLQVALDYATTSTANKHKSVIELLENASNNSKSAKCEGKCPFNFAKMDVNSRL